MIWIEIIILIFRYGPSIVKMVKEIIDLIKKKPAHLQPTYNAELLHACRTLRSNKNQQVGTNALMELKARLENA